MQAYILRTDRRIEPFGRAASEMTVHNRTVAETQRGILGDLGCRIDEIDDLAQIRQLPALVINDDLYCTHEALSRFLKIAKRGSGNARAALKKSILTEHAATTFQGPLISDASGQSCRAYSCYYLRDYCADLPLDQQSTLVPIPHRIIKFRLRANRRFVPGNRYVMPVSRVYMLPIHHWCCQVAANILGMSGFLLRQYRKRAMATMLMPLQAMFRAGSIRPTSLAGKSYLVGRRCRIHPTAQIYNSILGNRVCIGPFVTVRNSVIGDAVDIRAGAVVEASSLGRQVIVECNTLTRGCVADTGAMLASTFMQMSVFGRNAVICPGSGIADTSLIGTVPVEFQGQRVRSGSRFLGGCLADDAFMGAGIGANCGMELPQGCTIVRHPDSGVLDVSKSLPPDILRTDRGRKKSRPSSGDDVRKIA